MRHVRYDDKTALMDLVNSRSWPSEFRLECQALGVSPYQFIRILSDSYELELSTSPESRSGESRSGGRRVTPESKYWVWLLKIFQAICPDGETLSKQQLGRFYALTHPEMSPQRAADLLSTTLSYAKHDGWLKNPSGGTWGLSDQLLTVRRSLGRDVIAEDLENLASAAAAS